MHIRVQPHYTHFHSFEVALAWDGPQHNFKINLTFWQQAVHLEKQWGARSQHHVVQNQVTKKWQKKKSIFLSQEDSSTVIKPHWRFFFFCAVNNAINIKNISSNLIPFCSGLASRRSYYELVLLDAVKGLAFELFPSRLSRVQITAIFMWALSPPMWVSPRLFSEIQGLKHLYVLSFAVWCSVLHYRCIQHCPSTFTHL